MSKHEWNDIKCNHSSYFNRGAMLLDNFFVLRFSLSKKHVLPLFCFSSGRRCTSFLLGSLQLGACATVQLGLGIPRGQLSLMAKNGHEMRGSLNWWRIFHVSSCWWVARLYYCTSSIWILGGWACGIPLLCPSQCSKGSGLKSLAVSCWSSLSSQLFICPRRCGRHHQHHLLWLIALYIIRLYLFSLLMERSTGMIWFRFGTFAMLRTSSRSTVSERR